MLPEGQARKEIVKICQRLYEKGFIAAYDGNVSARVDLDRVLTTPSGVSKGFITEEDLIVTNLDGVKISGRLNPTSENVLHSLAYKMRPDINAVVHAHAPMAIAFSIAGVSLVEAILPEIVFTIGSIPTAHYATPTTNEVPESIKELIKNHDAIILAKHGTLTVGKTVEEAYVKVEKIEHTAKVIYYARSLGSVSRLSDDEVRKLLEVSGKFGLKQPNIIAEKVTPKGRSEETRVAVDDELVNKITALVVEELKKRAGINGN